MCISSFFISNDSIFIEIYSCRCTSLARVYISVLMSIWARGWICLLLHGLILLELKGSMAPVITSLVWKLMIYFSRSAMRMTIARNIVMVEWWCLHKLKICRFCRQLVFLWTYGVFTCSSHLSHPCDSFRNTSLVTRVTYGNICSHSTDHCYALPRAYLLNKARFNTHNTAYHVDAFVRILATTRGAMYFASRIVCITDLQWRFTFPHCVLYYLKSCGERVHFVIFLLYS